MYVCRHFSGVKELIMSINTCTISYMTRLVKRGHSYMKASNLQL